MKKEHKRYLLKKSLEAWFWIERLEQKFGSEIPEKYDKHLLGKVKTIQPLLDDLHSDFEEDALISIVERNLFLIGHVIPRRRRPHFGYDCVKSVLHNEILRPLDYDPLIESPNYKTKVMTFLRS